MAAMRASKIMGQDAAFDISLEFIIDVDGYSFLRIFVPSLVVFFYHLEKHRFFWPSRFINCG
jgi:hypothetical protein